MTFGGATSPRPPSPLEERTWPWCSQPPLGRAVRHQIAQAINVRLGPPGARGRVGPLLLPILDRPMGESEVGRRLHAIFAWGSRERMRPMTLLTTGQQRMTSARVMIEPT